MIKMTQQQWSQHTDHLKSHVSWPSTKADILKACNGEDVSKGVMKDLENLPDKIYQNESELKQMVVM